MRVLIQKVLQGTWSYRITDVLLQVIMFKRRFSRFNVLFRFLFETGTARTSRVFAKWSYCSAPVQARMDGPVLLRRVKIGEHDLERIKKAL